jgi:hypothetical protein
MILILCGIMLAQATVNEEILQGEPAGTTDSTSVVRVVDHSTVFQPAFFVIED